MNLNHTDRLILAKLREGRAKPAYLAEKLGKQQAYINQRLDGLVEAGAVDRVYRGLYGHAELERRVDAARLANTLTDDQLLAGGDQFADPPDLPTQRREEGGFEEPAPRVEPEKNTNQKAENDISGIEQLVDTLDLPGSGHRLDERRRAVKIAYQYIRERGTAQVQDIKAETWERTETGYGTERSLWANCVYGALQELADHDDNLEPPAKGEQLWSYSETAAGGIYDPIGDLD